MAVVPLLVQDQLALRTGEIRWRDLIVAKGHTARPLSGSPTLSSMTTGASMVIVCAGASVTTLSQLTDTTLPILVADVNRLSNLNLGSGNANPPSVAFWRSLVTGSPFLPGYNTGADIPLWSSDTVSRHFTTPCPGMTILATYPGNLTRNYIGYVAVGGALDGGGTAAGKRYVISLQEANLSTYYTSVTGNLMSAAFDQLMSGVETPPEQDLVVSAGADQSVAGGASFTATATIVSGTGPYTYLWENVSGPAVDFLAGETTATLQGVAPLVGGTSVVSVTALGAGGSSGTDTLSIVSSPRVRTGPTGGTLATGWSITGGGTVASTLDKLVGDEGAALISPAGTGGAAQEATWATIPATAQTTGAALWVTAYLTAPASSATVTVDLLEGATVRATKTFTPTTTRTRHLVSFAASDFTAVTSLSNCSFRLGTATTA